MNNENKSIENSINNSVISTELNNIGENLGEIAIDQILEDELIKEIPIISTIKSLAKGIQSINKNIFAKKILRFLYELKDIPEEERAQFILRIEIEDKFKNKVGETIMLILEKIDDFDKPAILGNLFKATIEGKFSYDIFLRLSNLIVRAFTPDLIKFYKYSTNPDINLLDFEEENLANLGLLRLDYKEMIENDNIRFSVSEIGKHFLDNAFKNDVQQRLKRQ